MKIDPNTTRLLSAIARNAKTGNDAMTTVAPSTQRGANTAVSRGTRLSASGLGEFDVDKVERLRAAFDAGSYEVNAGAIADGMLADARAFLSSGVF